jgi:RNA polymerase sigma factor (sigma-70 family)
MRASADADLLRRFTARRDEAAFAELLRRHGPMVFGVCRRVLGDAHDAEDAFQAAFLVLARRPRAVGDPAALASWLYGVALRTASKARIDAARQRRRDRCAARPETAGAAADVIWSDLRPVLDEEIARLPARLREAFVLCCLEGRSHEEAAQFLGRPAGTVASRLSRARQRLRGRLTRRGLTLAGVAALLAGGEADAAAPPVFFSAAAAMASAGPAAPRVIALTDGVFRAMRTAKLKAAGGLLLLTAAAGLGAGFAFRAPQTTATAAVPPAPPSGGDEDRDGARQAAAARPDAPPEEENKPGAGDVDGAVGEALNFQRKLSEKLSYGVKIQTTLDTVLDDLIRRNAMPWKVNEKAFPKPKKGEDPVLKTTIEPFELYLVNRSTVLKHLLAAIPAESPDDAATYVIRRDHIEITTRKAVRDEFYPGRTDPVLPPLAYASFKNEPLADALAELGHSTGGAVVLDPRTEEAKAKVSADLPGVPLDTAVRVLADMAGLRLVRLDSVYYVTSKENARRLQDEDDKRRRDKGKD